MAEPDLPIDAYDTLLRCKSSNSDPAADAVSVTFSFSPVNVTPPAFHVCAKFSTGASAVIVALNGVAGPSSVVATDCTVNTLGDPEA